MFGYIPFLAINLILKHWIVVAWLITGLMSLLYVTAFGVIPISASSIGGDYISLMIFCGMSLRVYISGIATGSSDLDTIDSDKILYKMIANIMIIAGFDIAIHTYWQLLITAPLIIIYAVTGIAMSDGNFILSKTKYKWVAKQAWKKELPKIILISIFTITLEYIGFRNGGQIPIGIIL